MRLDHDLCDMSRNDMSRNQEPLFDQVPSIENSSMTNDTTDTEVSDSHDCKTDDDITAYEAFDERIPWHFWLTVVVVVFYLGWRLVQGIAHFGLF